MSLRVATANSERRKLSLVRVLALAGIAGVVGLAGVKWAAATIPTPADDAFEEWFAPYVDVTLTPELHFEDPAEMLPPSLVLSFVVADPARSCVPTWGTYYDLEAAARALDLDRRIVRLQERGGEAVISFGGAQNDELAVACEDVDALTAAYASVIERYDVNILDFDIEGAALADAAANERRAEAIKRLQSEYGDLVVWFTLPVSPGGIGAESVALLDTTLAAGAAIDGVNVMTMNFGESGGDLSMGENAKLAMLATAQQVDAAYRRAGITLTEIELWDRLGATPMIGQNDIPGDVFTLDDARLFADFAADSGLGRLSFWSANRDYPCGTASADGRVSNTCSGVPQSHMEFTAIFGSGAFATSGTRPEKAPADLVASERDDQVNSPYPIWRPGSVYESGVKVTWQGRVYEAKWWTHGNQPDEPVKNPWDTPWRYLGPVLDADRQAMAEAKEVVDGQWPKYSAGVVYTAGDEVEYSNRIFRAKWWTQGDTPREDPDSPYDHPWEFVGVYDPNVAR
jgi:chitinase